MSISLFRRVNSPPIFFQILPRRRKYKNFLRHLTKLLLTKISAPRGRSVSFGKGLPRLFTPFRGSQSEASKRSWSPSDMASR